MAVDPENAEMHEVAARAAINMTLTALQTALATPRVDTTLCHGALGLSEVVLTAGELLDNDLWRTYARTTAAELIDRYVEHDDWPPPPPWAAGTPPSSSAPRASAITSSASPDASHRGDGASGKTPPRGAG